MIFCNSCGHKFDTTYIPSYCPNCGKKTQWTENDKAEDNKGYCETSNLYKGV